MNKAGILTFHNAENYGAALQTYALMKTVQKLGIECAVIDYRNRGVVIRNTLKNIYYLVTGQNPIKNHKLYHQFQRQFMNLTEKTYRKPLDFEKDADRFDFLLFGSDQIWNPDLANGFDPLYFGQFPTRAKKIAYSASLGKDQITIEERQKLNQLIAGLDAVGVREETMLPLIEREATCVVDPCMLLTAAEWAQIASKSVSKENFILVYQLFANKQILLTAERLAEEMHKEILVLSPYPILKDRKRFHQLGRISPTEFIGYYQQADVVISDSFHGSIFSILFQKLFYTILPSAKTSRITSLLETLALSDRIVTGADLPPDHIDYTNIWPRLESEIQQSMAYLRKHLEIE